MIQPTRHAAAVCALLLCGLGLAMPGTLQAQSGRAWRQDDRVLVTAFHRLGAVAADSRHVFAASPWGMIVHDPMAGRWLPPITEEDGYPEGELPTALAVDRIGDAVWLGTASGALFEYHRTFGRWQAYGPVAMGAIEAIVPGTSMTSDALFLRTRQGWLRLRRGSRLARPAAPAEVAAEAPTSMADVARDPEFQALRSTLTLDRQLRRWPIVDVAPGERQGVLWIATDGGNLFRYDRIRMGAEALPFGLLSRGSGALAQDGRMLWFGGDGGGPRRGVVRASLDLQAWQPFDAPVDGAPAGYVHAVLAAGDAVWFGAADGLFRLDRASEAWQRLTEADGLPSGSVRALASAGEAGLWVGTRRGLARVRDGAVVAPGTVHGWAVNRMALERDTLWVASDGGLWVVPEASAPAADAEAFRLLPAPGTAEWQELRGRVVDVVPLEREVLAITESALYRFDGRAWSGPFRDAAQGGLGRLHSLVAADGQLWVAGEMGVARWDRRRSPDARVWTYYLAGQDLPPATVRGILPEGDEVWVSTTRGALRLRWR